MMTGTWHTHLHGRWLALVLALALVGCSSSEERQAKYLARGQELMAAGDYAKAKLEIRNVLQINENHVEARYLYALLLEREQNYRQMFANLQLAVDLDPNYIDARIKLGQTYYRAQQYALAREQADAVLALEPDNADGLTLLGSVRYREGDEAGAVAAANQALAAEPGHVGATSILIEVYKEREPELALAAVGAGLEAQGEEATLRLLEISVFKAQGDDDAVIAGYRGLMASYPENLYYHYQLVQFLEERDRIDEAETVLRDIVKTRPDNTQLKLWLAEFLANQRNLQLAQSTVQEFIAREPGIYELRFALGKIYEALGEFDAAAAVYDEVIALDVEGADALAARNRKIDMLMRDMNVAAAEAQIAEVLAIEPENPEALIAQARIDVGRADYETAVSRLRTVTRNDPKNAQAWARLGQANALRGANDLAIDNYKTVLALAPANLGALAAVTRLLEARGEGEAAKALLDTALAIAPDISPETAALQEFAFQNALATEDSMAQDAAIGWFEQAGYAPQALLLEAISLNAAEDYPAAEAALMQSIGDGSPSNTQLRLLVSLALAQEAGARGIEVLEGLKSRHPDNPYIPSSLALLYGVSGDEEKAEAATRESLAVQPNGAAFAQLAQLLAGQGREADALEEAGRYESALGSDERFLLAKAQLEEAIEKFDEAAATYQAILMLNPASTVAANNYAMLLMDDKYGDEGIRLSLSLSARFSQSSNASLLDTYGRALLLNNRPSEAREVLLRASTINGIHTVDPDLIKAAESQMKSSNP